MTCHQTADFVTDYLEGVLAPEVRRQVEEHLATCKDCPAYFNQMREFVRALPAAKEQAVPAAVPTAILEAFLSGKSPQKARWLGIPRRVAFSLAVLIAVLAIIWMSAKLGWHRGSGPSHVPAPQFEAAVLDLREWHILRGENNPLHAPLQLQRQPLAVSILLPIGREPGAYEVTLSRISEPPLIRATAEGYLEDHTTVLHVKVDLTALPSGTYQLGIRQSGWDWTYYPVTLR